MVAPIDTRHSIPDRVPIVSLHPGERAIPAAPLPEFSDALLLAAVVATCKMADVNPVDYIDTTLRAILDGHPQSRIEDLMPWRFKQPSSLTA